MAHQKVQWTSEMEEQLVDMWRSKEVNRHREESVLHVPVQPQYDEPHWRLDVPLPWEEESFRYEPFLDPGLYSTSHAGMASRRKGLNVGLTHENLPHPSQLMGKRKRDQGLQKPTANVLKHLRELRMRQRHINALKEDKWWGATGVSSPEESRSPTEAGSEQLFGLTAGISFSTMLLDNPDLTMTKPYEAASSLTHQEYLFRGYEQFLDLAPGGNPMMAFVAGTAHKSLLVADDAMVNPAGSDVFLRTIDDEMALLQNIQFF
ncbi:uncharacterized protein LOC130082436 [Rhinichthys klamathensis goyatoka]|uniref:uncharacterized protein LOC130082436 n=1 Tax=Rhinichthys klamathensis goyatoka TaxID=3034132 RepID=UPI0024B5568E|nr:uncharacterized protein LOC130082436 [Rhinichthys klamathensis goyatoka]